MPHSSILVLIRDEENVLGEIERLEDLERYLGEVASEVGVVRKGGNLDRKVGRSSGRSSRDSIWFNPRHCSCRAFQQRKPLLFL